MITYGLKGLSAYSKHANVLMQDNAELDAFCSAPWPLPWMTLSLLKIM